MKVKLEHIQQGVIKWYEKEIAPLGMGPAVVGILVPNMVRNLPLKYPHYINLIFDENGEIETDALMKELAKLIDNKGEGRKILGVVLKKEDIKSLEKFINDAVPEAEIAEAT